MCAINVHVVKSTVGIITHSKSHKQQQKPIFLTFIEWKAEFYSYLLQLLKLILLLFKKTIFRLYVASMPLNENEHDHCNQYNIQKKAKKFDHRGLTNKKHHLFSENCSGRIKLSILCSFLVPFPVTSALWLSRRIFYSVTSFAQ